MNLSMRTFTRLYLVILELFASRLTAADGCVEGHRFELEFRNAVPSEVASLKKVGVTQGDCAMWCYRLYAGNCGAVFFQKENRSCSIYNSSFPCLTLHDLSGTQGFVYVKSPPQPIKNCLVWPATEGIHPLNISGEVPTPTGYYDSDEWLETGTSTC
ncbi:uncharacterized protein LOC121379262 isoform X2 [Gigantopelta aegis]|uniref:uncharacterized protein LOC121379262 isoform X2 n=1 Tax=Gigantopelta aegis TaxID=1735272 RepID=UPI001B88B746|nr:uncharacterized protein LOC121379262 isoform X2 [Gigantopelta aegis]